MRWLVTIDAQLGLEQLQDLLEGLGVQDRDDLDPIPVDGDQVIEVEGPADLPERAAKEPAIRAVHPSSKMTPYATGR